MVLCVEDEGKSSLSLELISTTSFCRFPYPSNKLFFSSGGSGNYGGSSGGDSGYSNRSAPYSTRGGRGGRGGGRGRGRGQ